MNPTVETISGKRYAVRIKTLTMRELIDSLFSQAGTDRGAAIQHELDRRFSRLKNLQMKG